MILKPVSSAQFCHRSIVSSFSALAEADSLHGPNKCPWRNNPLPCLLTSLAGEIKGVLITILFFMFILSLFILIISDLTKSCKNNTKNSLVDVHLNSPNVSMSSFVVHCALYTPHTHTHPLPTTLNLGVLGFWFFLISTSPSSPRFLPSPEGPLWARKKGINLELNAVVQGPIPPRFLIGWTWARYSFWSPGSS